MKQKHFPGGLEKVPKIEKNFIKPILETKADGSLETEEEAWERINKKLRSSLLRLPVFDYNVHVLKVMDEMNRKLGIKQ